MNTKNWEVPTRKFMAQFVSGCPEQKNYGHCDGCDADMDGIIDHIETLLSTQRAEVEGEILSRILMNLEIKKTTVHALSDTVIVTWSDIERVLKSVTTNRAE